jgi:Methyltransferase FkbM domain
MTTIMKSSAWLLEHKSNNYSQTGEDGVIAKILATLPITDSWCVEFGAWDGKYLCNVRDLIENRGYSGVLIEASRQKFSELTENYRNYPNVALVNQFVGFQPDDNLDTILERTDIPQDFDFLSIDIDGNDYHVWKMVTQYRPKVVCIEFNPTISSQVEFIQEANPNVSHGSSVSALVALAKQKRYELICIVGCNAIFVDAPYYSHFHIEDNRVETLWVESDAITHVFVGYDGKIFLEGKKSLPWHGIKLKSSDFQVMPAFLQKYPGNYGFLEKALFAIYLLFRDPAYLMHKLRTSQGKMSSK